MSDSVLIIGNGQISKLQGKVGQTPECSEALFKSNQMVRVRRLKHLRDLPENAAVVCVVPPNFSPEHAWADYCKKPRPLMCQVPSKFVQYIIAFEGNPKPMLIRETWLRPSTLPDANVAFAGDPA